MLTDEVVKGRREGLTALRDTLAASIDGTRDVRSLAALAKQLTEVLRELDSLPVAEGVSTRDQLADARASRRAAAGLPAHPAISDKRRG